MIDTLHRDNTEKVDSIITNTKEVTTVKLIKRKVAKQTQREKKPRTRLRPTGVNKGVQHNDVFGKRWNEANVIKCVNNIYAFSVRSKQFFDLTTVALKYFELWFCDDKEYSSFILAVTNLQQENVQINIFYQICFTMSMVNKEVVFHLIRKCIPEVKDCSFLLPHAFVLSILQANLDEQHVVAAKSQSFALSATYPGDQIMITLGSMLMIFVSRF